MAQRVESEDGAAGRVPVVGADVDVAFSIRGTTGELELDVRATTGASGPDLPAIVAAIDEIRRGRPDVSFHLAADHPVDVLDPLPEAVADAAGLPSRRELLQLRRPLPVGADHPTRRRLVPLALRPIDLGTVGHGGSGEGDVAAWLRVNNRTFAEHPDQGAETVETFRRRLDVEQQDPSGFLVADDPVRPGELSGFCWTKVHPATDVDPTLGEIYVIGVDPSHHGQGLGVALVLAGLDHLAASGVPIANLYVDADNGPARRLYDRLGFTVHERRRVYTP